MLPSIELNTIPIHPQAREGFRELKQKILTRVHQLCDTAWISEDDIILDLLTGVLSALVGLSLASISRHSPHAEKIVELLAGVLIIELHHWHMRDELQRQSSSVQRFLAGESVGKDEVMHEKMLSRHLRWLRPHSMSDVYSGFADFYRCCAQAQARLLDYAADSLFVIQMLRFIVTGEMEQGMLFPFVRGIAEDVIIKKTVSHEIALKIMAKALMTTEYFREFDGVLGTVLADWGLEND